MVYVNQLKTCCFIGDYLQFSSTKANVQYPYKIELKAVFRERIIHLIEDLSVTHFMCGMELGIEQYAAEIILDLKKLYPQIKLEGVLPFETHAAEWLEYDRDRYFSIMKRIDKETLLQYHYSKDCMRKRDLYMISKSKYIITVSHGADKRIDNLISQSQSTGRVVYVMDLQTPDIKPNIRICR